MDENEIKLEAETRAMEKENRYWTGVIEAKKKENKALMDMESSIKQRIEEENRVLNDTMNEISIQRLAWLKEKEQEMADIEAKKDAIQAILDKENNLRMREEELEIKKQGEVDILNETKRREMLCEEKITQANSVLKQAEEKHKEVSEIIASGNKKMQEFKDKVISVLKDVNEL